MKERPIIIIIISLLLSLPANAADFYFFGVNGKWLKTTNWIEFIAGGVFAPIVHESCHIIYLEIAGYDYSYNVLKEEITVYDVQDHSRSSLKWAARAGLLGEQGVNTILTTWFRDTDFTRGYTVIAGIDYLRNDSDIDTIDMAGGHGRAEWAGMGAIVLHNIFRIEW